MILRVPAPTEEEALTKAQDIAAGYYQVKPQCIAVHVRGVDVDIERDHSYPSDVPFERAIFTTEIAAYVEHADPSIYCCRRD